MYPALVLALAIMFGLLMNGVAGQHMELASRYRSQVQLNSLVALAEEMEQFYYERSGFPADRDELKLTAGFEQSRGHFVPEQGYSVSPDISDGVWTFSRAVLFNVLRSDGTTDSTYLAANACGAGPFSSASSWCGAMQSKWFRRETRERFNDQIATQRARMGRTLQKFSDYYNASSGFPDRDSFYNVLAANSTVSLASVAGYVGTGAACSGTYVYMGVPVDCADMFDQWGKPVGYQFISKKRVILLSETPIRNAVASPIVVAVEYDYSLM